MRGSGLAIRDALTLKRREIQYDVAKDLHRIVTSRQKTGTHVSVPIPSEIATELLTVANGNSEYVFWIGKGEKHLVRNKRPHFGPNVSFDALPARAATLAPRISLRWRERRECSFPSVRTHAH